MAVAKPLVASAVGANRNIIQPGSSGFLTESREKWAAALAQLCEDESLRAKMGAAGRYRVEREFSTEIAARSLLDTLGGQPLADVTDCPGPSAQ
jgi:glycosyltransferase involved in cell wall biosynthesis